MRMTRSRHTLCCSRIILHCDGERLALKRKYGSSFRECHMFIHAGEHTKNNHSNRVNNCVCPPDGAVVKIFRIIVCCEMILCILNHWWMVGLSLKMNQTLITPIRYYKLVLYWSVCVYHWKCASALILVYINDPINRCDLSL